MLGAICTRALCVHRGAKTVHTRLLSTTPVLFRKGGSKKKGKKKSKLDDNRKIDFALAASNYKKRLPILDIISPPKVDTILRSKVDTESWPPKADTVLPKPDTTDQRDHDPNPETNLGLLPKKDYTGRHAVFQSTVIARLQRVLQLQYESAQFVQGVMSKDDLQRKGLEFMKMIDGAFALAGAGVTTKTRNPLFWNLRDAFIHRDVKGLHREIQYSFQSFITLQRFSEGIQESHSKLLDFHNPAEWFPATRSMQRVIHVHVGPTNSGKTYHALKALENSKSGVYAGPLRLLAAEVFHRFRAKDIPCALITGEEQRIPTDTDRFFSSCTVEMVPLNRPFDVAVIDEIQMIGHPDRGNAWTSAFLGVKAKEVHVCGEERTVSLLEALCATTGEKCIIHRYHRLCPLKTMSSSIESLKKLRKGDAVVAFSRVALHALKRQIEQMTGRRCAIIYGSLPPEVRVQQADLFNEPDNDYDFIVASDAIGMGLNLEVRRVIFESVYKFDGTRNRVLEVSELKQIGGRAGRYRSAVASKNSTDAQDEQDKVGYVTSMDMADVKTIQKAFGTVSPDIEQAYLEPPPGIVERFASYFPTDTPLSFILMRIKTSATVSPLYAIHITTSILDIADIIHEFRLSISDRLTICHMPIPTSNPSSPLFIQAIARIIANNEAGDLLSISEVPFEYLDTEIGRNATARDTITYLNNLETLHVAINCYIWLSYRFTGMFRDMDLAFHVRSLVEKKLTQSLEMLDFTDQQMISRRQLKRKQATKDSFRKSITLETEEVKSEAKSVPTPMGEEGRSAAVG